MSDWHWLDPKPEQRRVLDEFEIRLGTVTDFKRLIKFHYITDYIPKVRRMIFVLVHRETQIVYGVMMYAAPLLENTGRTQGYVGRLLSKCKTRAEKYALLNKTTIRGTRVVIHPSLRGTGAVSYLIDQTWRQMPYPFVEFMSIMLYYHNFLPKTYSEYIKLSVPLSKARFFGDQGKGGQMQERVLRPRINFGYALFINKKILEEWLASGKL